MSDIKHCLEKIVATIGSAPVEIIAVSKGQSCASIREAFSYGIKQFAENDIQVAIQKQTELQNQAIQWHYVGIMQTRKSPLLAKHFSWVDSICSIKQAKKLDSECLKLNKKMNILIQVNISGSEQQSGCNTNELANLIDEIQPLANVALHGLMCIASKEQAENDFKNMAQIYQHMCSIYGFDTLSMGMSADYLLAIKHGATQVRLGKIIFGERK